MGKEAFSVLIGVIIYWCAGRLAAWRHRGVPPSVSTDHMRGLGLVSDVPLPSNWLCERTGISHRPLVPGMVQLVLLAIGILHVEVFRLTCSFSVHRFRQNNLRMIE